MNDLKFTTASDFVADAKGIPTEKDLIQKLHEGFLKVSFKKLDGDERVMTCTKMLELIPKSQQPKTESQPKPGTITVWVPDADGWRSFRYDRVFKVEDVSI